MLIIWKGIAYVLLGVGAIAALLMVLAIINPKLTLRFWKLQRRRHLVVFYLIMAVMFLGFSSEAFDASLSPEERAAQQAETEAWRAERERKAAEKKAEQIAELVASARAIPASDIDGNLKAYKRLAKQLPENSEYKEKVAHYQALVTKRDAEAARKARIRSEEKAKIDSAENAELARREALYGKKPIQGSYDNRVPIVKQYLESIANDPGSIKYDRWWPVMFSEKDGWRVKCDWRARNAYGAYVRSTDLFIIRFGRVVSMTK